ncbi:MAG: hypothetical protein BGO99_11405 [Nitrosospira sp. 56-18]|nr:MAG: hypothetical protein BGO99_11405 [Nitrosospira sp. 56-18]
MLLRHTGILLDINIISIAARGSWAEIDPGSGFFVKHDTCFPADLGLYCTGSWHDRAWFAGKRGLTFTPVQHKMPGFTE